jgi:LmbE family N-acetylglucosaminyl deacetylase
VERGPAKVALHVSPHPDDELLGAPATLMALRDAGWRVVNLACGLGRPDQGARREAELHEACRRAGFELLLPAGSSGQHRAGIASVVGRALADLRPSIVVSPGPHELHPTHAIGATAVHDALDGLGPEAPRWWMWAFWGSLREPTLAAAFGQERLEEILDALAAHEGELARVDYRRAVEGRGAMLAALAPELLFGFGSAARYVPEYAELLTESVRASDGWRLTLPRLLDPNAPLGEDSGKPALVE